MFLCVSLRCVCGVCVYSMGSKRGCMFACGVRCVWCEMCMSWVRMCVVCEAYACVYAGIFERTIKGFRIDHPKRCHFGIRINLS